MKRFFIFTFAALVMLTLFTLLLKYFPSIKTKPDITLILVVYVAVASERSRDIILAFTLGYIYDIFSGSPVGLFAMLRTVDFIITRFFNMNFFSKNALFFIVITFVISVFDSIYLGYQFNQAQSGFFSILSHALYLSLINAIAALIMYPLLDKIEGLYLKTVEQTEGRY